MTARHALLVKRCRKYAGLLLLLAAFSAAAGTAGERRWIITMTWLPQAQFAGVYYAKEAGIFEKYGLSVEIRHKTAELSIIDYLTQKRSEFIVAPLATALLARSEKVPLVNIGQVSQSGAVMLVAAGKNGIRKAEDLKKPDAAGKPRRFGIWSVDFGMAPLAFLRKQGVAGEIVPLNTDIALFLWGAVDVISVMEYNEYYQILASGRQPAELTVFRLRDYGIDVPEDGVYTLESTAAEYPGVCLALRRAVMEGWSEAVKHPKKALEYVWKYCARDNGRFDPAHQYWMLTVYGKLLGLGTPQAGVLSPAAYDAAVKLFRRSGLIAGSVDYRQFCPNLAETSGGRP